MDQIAYKNQEIPDKSLNLQRSSESEDWESFAEDAEMNKKKLKTLPVLIFLKSRLFQVLSNVYFSRFWLAAYSSALGST